MIILHETIEVPFIDYCAYFNGNKDYFECHEVLEEFWKEIAPGDKSHVIVGFIQVATSLYHWRRGNVRGAKKSMKSAIDIIRNQKETTYVKIIDGEVFLANCEQALQKMKDNVPYEAFNILFKNAAFFDLVTKRISTLPVEDENFIHHKHKLRDRSDVILARAIRLAEKQL
ncbi:MAG: DUF309 domain-containing protein [Lysinibacillus sp.]